MRSPKRQLSEHLDSTEPLAECVDEAPRALLPPDTSDRSSRPRRSADEYLRSKYPDCLTGQDSVSKHSVTQTDTTRLLVYSPYFLDSSYYKSLVIRTLLALLVTCPKLCILVLHWQLAMSVGFFFRFFYFTIA